MRVDVFIQSSGRIYHTRYQPPRIPNQDDVTGEPLVQRPDDNITAIQKRLALYHENIQPLRTYYQNALKTNNPFTPQWTAIDANVSIMSLQAKIKHLLEATDLV